MNLPDASSMPIVTDELDLLAGLVPLDGIEIIELGCGNARTLRSLLKRHPASRAVGLEVDTRQHAANLAEPQERLQFLEAGAQSIPFADARFDLAMMLKSLHHVPVPLMAQALDEAARVLRPGGYLYVSEPVYAGALNELIRLFNEEARVRTAAQAALDDALLTARWSAVADLSFLVPVRFRDFAEFEQRMMRPTFADHRIDDAKLAQVRAAFDPHCGPEGARFESPMHVRLLRRQG